MKRYFRVRYGSPKVNGSVLEVNTEKLSINGIKELTCCEEDLEKRVKFVEQKNNSFIYDTFQTRNRIRIQISESGDIEVIYPKKKQVYVEEINMNKALRLAKEAENYRLSQDLIGVGKNGVMSPPLSSPFRGAF